VTVLLVASAGGHLTQLHLLAASMDPSPQPRVWVTYDSPQAASLLADEAVVSGYSPTTRNIPNAIRNYRLAKRILATSAVSRVVSTGGGIAVPFMISARRRGIGCHYIESATRLRGPSLSGRMLERVPGVQLYTQHRGWDRPRWRYAGSVLDRFDSVIGTGTAVRRILVTLGTHTYAFPRLVEGVLRLLSGDEELIWQVGATTGHDLPGEVHSALSSARMGELLRSVDVVIGHAGMGTALSALMAGKVPVLVPRRKDRGEHVDDHQAALAEELQRRGLAVTGDADQLTREALETAASSTVRTTEARPFRLSEG
jgi:UDP-N-acetylglucosamine--N-acetylmuramyl-(pentapeptide) pyrophosphoryl-undecaprenol N-acetylglucosamine transferase